MGPDCLASHQESHVELYRWHKTMNMRILLLNEGLSNMYVLIIQPFTACLQPLSLPKMCNINCLHVVVREKSSKKSGLFD